MIPFWPARPQRIWPGALFSQLCEDRAWSVEPKFDGYRCVVQWTSNDIKAWSRHGKMMELPSDIRAALGQIDVPDGTAMDGELLGPRNAGQEKRLMLFDIPVWAGEPDRRLTYHERRLRLAAVVGAETSAPVYMAFGLPNRVGSYELALDTGHEGVVLKRRDALYPFGHSASGPETREWLKCKAPTENGRMIT